MATPEIEPLEEPTLKESRGGSDKPLDDKILQRHTEEAKCKCKSKCSTKECPCTNFGALCSYDCSCAASKCTNRAAQRLRGDLSKFDINEIGNSEKISMLTLDALRKTPAN